MNNVTLTGRMYNGKVHEYTENGTRIQRTMFRGRFNYRLDDGEYAWIDVACFRDNPNSDANGYVGFLENNYTDQAGRAIEIQGQLRPTTKQKSHTLNLKGGKKKDIDGIPYETFEIVIDRCGFLPTSQGDTNNEQEYDLDDEDIDELELEDEEDELIDEEDDIEADDEPTPPARGSNRNRSGNASAGRGGNSGNRSSGNRTGNSGSSSRSGNRTAAGTGNGGGAARNGNSSSRSAARSGKGGGKSQDKKFFLED